MIILWGTVSNWRLGSMTSFTLVHSLNWGFVVCPGHSLVPSVAWSFDRRIFRLRAVGQKVLHFVCPLWAAAQQAEARLERGTLLEHRNMKLLKTMEIEIHIFLSASEIDGKVDVNPVVEGPWILTAGQALRFRTAKHPERTPQKWCIRSP